MTTPAVGVTTIHPTRPFITPGLYKQEPMGVPADNLVSGGSPLAQENELRRIIQRASAEMNSFCYGASGGVLHATVDTEAYDVRMDHYGQLTLTPSFTPVLALTALSYGSDPSYMSTQTDFSQVKVKQHEIKVLAYPFTGQSSQGPLQFGRISGPDGRYWTQYSYVNGWPLTSLTANVTAGTNVVIPVGDTTGIYAGATTLTIRSPFGQDESFIPTAVTSTSVTAATLQYNHQQGDQCDALHEDIYSAAVEIITGMLKRRAADQVSGPAKRGVEPDDGSANMAEGFDLLSDFVQERTLR
jgi:hypothetical protein